MGRLARLVAPFGALALAATSVLILPPSPAAAAEDATAWVRPVSGAVVAPFVPGTGRFGIGGHTGVDLAARPGAPVRAAGRGVVSFAGEVGGDPFVVVAHDGELRTTYGYLESVRVRRGQRIGAGTVVGTVGGGPGHPPGTLHFGLRRATTYLDPMSLFVPVDLTDVVSLAPDARAAAAPGHRWRTAGLPSFWHGIGGATRWVADGGAGAVQKIQAWAGRVAQRAPGVIRRVAATQLAWAIRLGVAALVTPALGPVAAAELGALTQQLVWEVGQGTADWWRRRRRCSPRAPGGRDVRGNGHELVAVGGVGSAPGAGGATFALPARSLGYDPGDVTWFTYGDATRSVPSDSWTGVDRAAARLAADLRARARERPGIPVDLVGHSLGGVVIEAFLKEHYAGHEKEYPRLGRVVTLASPHGGSALAGRFVSYATVPLLGRLLDAVADVAGTIPPSSPTARDVAPGSATLRRLRSRPLPAGVAVTTIGAVDDVIVTADRTRLAGAEHVVVNPRGVGDHAAIVASEAGLAAARLALSGRPPPCESLATMLRARVEPYAIARAIGKVGAFR